jgi:hypothetical protein
MDELRSQDRSSARISGVARSCRRSAAHPSIHVAERQPSLQSELVDHVRKFRRYQIKPRSIGVQFIGPILLVRAIVLQRAA